MKWIPPIPTGALYSKPARKLGPGLALLAYCYDLVDRDGWFTIALKTDVTSDLDEPYPTVKRWWQLLEAGPFFAEVQRHGRNGMRVRFKDAWLEWRILKARTPPPELNGTDTGSEMIPNEENCDKRDTIGIINGTDTGSEMIPDHNVYGTHDSDQADLLPPPPPQPPRTGGGGGRKPSELERLFGSYGIGTAHDLADLYEREYPDLDLETIRQSCENVFERGHEHAAYRLLRRLKSSPPEPGKPYPRAGPHHTQQQTISAAAIPLIRAPDTPAPKYDPARAKAILDERLGKRS